MSGSSGTTVFTCGCGFSREWPSGELTRKIIATIGEAQAHMKAFPLHTSKIGSKAKKHKLVYVGLEGFYGERLIDTSHFHFTKEEAEACEE